MIKINKNTFPVIKNYDIGRGVYGAYPIIKDETLNYIKSLSKFELKTLFPQYDGKDFDEMIHTPHYVGATEFLPRRIFEDHRKPSQPFLKRATKYYFDMCPYDLRENYEWRLICDGTYMSIHEMKAVERHYQELWDVKFDFQKHRKILYGLRRA